MAEKYFRNSAGQYIKQADSTYLKAEECETCCEPGVDCETNGPTADFSVSAASGRYCVDFTDESVAGEGCTITSWFWQFGDGATSSLQNPSHCYAGIGPYTVTLDVYDDCDCSDSVTGDVEFDDGADGGCECTPDPSSAIVTVSGLGDRLSACPFGIGTPTDCRMFNRTYELFYTGISTGPDCSSACTLASEVIYFGDDVGCDNVDDVYGIAILRICGVEGSPDKVEALFQISQTDSGGTPTGGGLLQSDAATAWEVTGTSDCYELIGASGLVESPACPNPPSDLGSISLDALFPTLI